MATDIRLANSAWESLLTAHAVLLRDFAAEGVWHEQGLTMREYDVLYTLSKCPDPDSAGTRIGELQGGVLLSQPGLSRMVDRLVQRGLVERAHDAADGRAVRVRLTAAGRALQQAVGRAHARSVSHAVGQALDADEMRELERLCRRLIDHRRSSTDERGTA